MFGFTDNWHRLQSVACLSGLTATETASIQYRQIPYHPEDIYKKHSLLRSPEEYGTPTEAGKGNSHVLAPAANPPRHSLDTVGWARPSVAKLR